ncbi:hypothetical protein J3Q64DRAFT_1875414 [Phycomyces blakesleeanus]|uniref:NmrA-like domain-containing protein n=2 Tax=Phycomyces blakesleeanus TaxID=4837 RepID=A0A167R411_PHYB8|nr:hypothetical protein PHYBLDRAFT_161441 [Phycomyces blakesleeanus NRRL 1555(-)]OAD80798.1 hypothetical protein PHYBLDRAFT_161441 [Phycomyces blakesleeanus NRRL 1555(-)]|eukprot:XP_018298838.1 hypothetical protein PHYBLDRAFT_161441 [Phycomyces blakesleeanus NRRL 1555(-)]
MSQDTWTFSNTDSLLGYAFAFYFLEKRNNGTSKHNIRLLCRNKDGLEELERLGGEVIEVDYRNECDIQTAIAGTRFLMFNPEFSGKRIWEAKTLLNASKCEGVEYVTITSFIGVDRVLREMHNNKHDFSNMVEYYHLEEQVRHLFGDDNHCVVRLPFFSQSLYYFSPMIEKESMIGMPVDTKARWPILSLLDVVQGMYHLWTENQIKRLNHIESNKALFQFTSAYNQDGKGLSIIFSEVLGRTTQYTQISASNMRAYLQDIRENENFQERPFSQESKDPERPERDVPFTFPIARYLNDNYIDTLLELWLMFDCGFSDILTDDLSNALGYMPQELSSFVQNNRDQFRRLQ